MKRYYRRIAPLLSGNYILPSPAHCEISRPSSALNDEAGKPRHCSTHSTRPIRRLFHQEQIILA